MTSMNVSLPESLRLFAEERASKGYSSISEYLRELIREDQKRAEGARLEALLLEGVESGKPIQIGKKYWEKKRQALNDKLRKDRE